MIVTTKQLFEVAYGRFAVGAYNINNMEQTLGLFKGSLDSKAPFIIQISKGARSYADKRMLEAMIKAAAEIFPEAIFAVHLDHGDLPTALDCIESGFYSSVMIDASSQPLEENIRITKAGGRRRPTPRGSRWRPNWASSAGWRSTCRWRRTTPISPTRTRPRSSSRNRGATAWRWPSARAMAPTSSAARRPCVSTWRPRSRRGCRASRWSCTGRPRCRRKKCARINEAGGALKGAKGVDEDEFAKAVPLGVTKVNIDTDGRLVWTRVHREFFRDNPEKFDLRDPGKIFVAEYAEVHRAQEREAAVGGDA